MRVVLPLLLSILLGVAHPANAGAWMREKGSTFMAVSFSATYFRDIANTTYIEHGFRDDLTLGADIGIATTRYGQQGGYGTIFIRRPIRMGGENTKWAYELGVGAAWIGDLVLPHVKTGLSWGRGFTLREKHGWMTVDASVTWDLGQGAHLTKVDTTVGLSFTERTSGMVQVYLAHLDGATYGTLAPSVIWKPKKGKFKLQVGFEAPMDNLEDTALKLGIWREF